MHLINRSIAFDRLLLFNITYFVKIIIFLLFLFLLFSNCQFTGWPVISNDKFPWLFLSFPEKNCQNWQIWNFIVSWIDSFLKKFGFAIVIWNNIVLKFARCYLSYCNIFLHVPHPTECTEKVATEECSTLFVLLKFKYYSWKENH